METNSLGQGLSPRLLLKDVNSKLEFLVDTGSDVSIIPRNKQWKGKPLKFRFFAANQTPINVYGIVNRTILFEKGEAFTWPFYVADVSHPILGADALMHLHLLPDLKKKRLIDSFGQIYGQGTVSTSDAQSNISIIEKSQPFGDILKDFPSVIGIAEPISVSKEHNVFHRIKTTDEPVAEKARRLSPEKLKAAKAEFSRLFKLGHIRPSKSPWAAPIHLVPKGKGFRIVGDYRRLNARTVPDRYPIKRLMDFTTILKKCKIFSTLDLKRAYNQIPVHPDDVEKTAVITPFGLFESLVMTFGLRNAAQSFQRYADAALSDLPFAFVYIDDILIASSTPELHKMHLKIVLERLHKFGLQLNLEKCALGQTEVKFLGFTINENGYKPLEDKVKSIVEYPQPKTVDELRRFLGMMNFYRECIPRVAHSQIHLNKYLKKAKKKDKTPIVWDAVSEQAFADCKKLLAEATLMAFPDEDAELRLVTDASDLSMGAALEVCDMSAREKGMKPVWRPLAFFSRKFNPAQRKYSTYDRELMAIAKAVKHFHYSLEGRSFHVCTDHKPLLYIQIKNHDAAPSHRVRRVTFLSEYDITYSYLPGEDNSVADVLSRIESIQL